MRRTVWLAVLLAALAVAGTFSYQARAQQPAAPAAAAPPAGPVHVITFVDITPNNKDAGTELCKQFIADTRKDPGVTRAEVLVQTNRTNHMVLDIVFQNQAAFDRHAAAQHTKDFHAKIFPMIGSPFDERPHYVLQ